jgi:predicted metal-dependent phosphoesterase TrpH
LLQKLKGNLHTHTTFSDGMHTPEYVADKYLAAGYDFLAFTDHRCFIGPGAHSVLSYWARLPDKVGEMLILHGYEEEPVEIQGRHLNIIRAGNEELRIINHPNEYGLSIADVKDAVAKTNAHAVEVTCHGRYLERYDTDELGVPRVATDDSHFGSEIGVSWIEVEAEKDPVSILKAIKAGSFVRRIRGRD